MARAGIGHHPLLAARRSGVLLHPTSLPGRWGSGDIGRAAWRFIDDLARAGQGWWQMLPVNPPSRPPGNSPYSSASAMASSPWLISPEMLVEEGLLGRNDLAPVCQANPARADFVYSRRVREGMLRRAHENAVRKGVERSEAYARFAEAQGHWLGDYCLFAAVSEKFGDSHWATWPEGIRLRKRRAMEAARRELAGEIAFHRFCQFEFDRQWRGLRGHARGRGVGLIGDVPMFVSHNSADVWAHPELFVLERKSGRATVVSGAPPDVFCDAGQKWGHPHYRWSAHRRTGFAWWVARFRRMFEHFDCVRIDHFLGFYRAWAVPAASDDARAGRWMKSPGEELFSAVAREVGGDGGRCIIAEDLGTITPGAMALRERFGFPGMRVLHFGFGEDDYHLPHRYARHAVAYTGTHDNDTTVGWLASIRAAGNGPLERASEYVGLSGAARHGGGEGAWPFIRAVATSVANTAIFPAQDLLGLGSDSRMNVPGTCDDNWGWRMTGPLPTPVIRKLGKLTETSGRAGRRARAGM